MTKQQPYAIIQSGNKQYQVSPGDVIQVELLHAEAGATVDFSNVILFHNGTSASVGVPHVAQAIVRGEVLGEIRGPKVISFKYKRRKNCRKKIGHRQNYSRVKITECSA